MAWNGFCVTEYSYISMFRKNIIKFFVTLSDIFRSKHFSITSAEYHLGWLQSTAVRSNVIVQRITKDRLEFYCNYETEIIYFYCLLSQLKALTVLATTIFNYLLYNDKKKKNPFNPVFKWKLVSGRLHGRACPSLRGDKSAFRSLWWWLTWRTIFRPHTIKVTRYNTRPCAILARRALDCCVKY